MSGFPTPQEEELYLAGLGVGDEPPVLDTPDSSPLTDFRDTATGRAELFGRLHGENLRYCALWRQWYLWNGIRWRVDDVGEIHRRAGDVARRLYAAASQSQSDRRPWLASCARKADSARCRRDLVV